MSNIIQDVAAGLSSTASDLLSVWGQYEATRLNMRFMELQNQVALLQAVSKPSNPQGGAPVASAGGASEWIKANPALAAGLAVGAGLLIYLAVK